MSRIVNLDVLQEDSSELSFGPVGKFVVTHGESVLGVRVDSLVLGVLSLPVGKPLRAFADTLVASVVLGGPGLEALVVRSLLIGELNGLGIGEEGGK